MSTIWTDSGISCRHVTFYQQYAKYALLTATSNAFLSTESCVAQDLTTRLAIYVPPLLAVSSLDLYTHKEGCSHEDRCLGATSTEPATGSRLDWTGRPKRRAFQSNLPRGFGSTSAS